MAASMGARSKYLFYFAHEHLDFRIAELTSILSIFNLDVKLPPCDVKDPFLVLELSSEEQARQIASRSVLLRSIYKLWAQGDTHQELNHQLRCLTHEYLVPHLQSTESYKFEVVTFNKTLNVNEKVQRIEDLPHDVLEFEGKVNLKSATRVYSMFEFYGPFGTQPTEEPQKLYFGQWLVDGQRDNIQKYDLKKRYFIANTSMDACLSIIMANLCKVTQNSLVLDPFVGSGSLLVSAAHFGAYVMGTDLNYLLLHGRAKPTRPGIKERQGDESIRMNLRLYGLEDRYLDVMVADASRAAMWRQQTLFHAIITDPPYGVREKTKKVGAEEKDKEIDKELIEPGKHFSRKRDYHLSDMFKDLLNFSARYLYMHGRLVYWFPVSIKDYREENVPSHPCLKLVHNCEQPLTSQLSRRLITMEKVAQCTENTAEAEVKIDHFEDQSFRDMFFNEETVQKEKIPGIKKKKPKQKNNSNSNT